MDVFENSHKKSGSLTKLKKISDFVSLNLPNFLYSKALKW